MRLYAPTRGVLPEVSGAVRPTARMFPARCQGAGKLGSMTKVTCPACGVGFETAATTNTRCRRCRKVVHIGSSPRRTARVELDDGYYYEEGEPASSGAGGALALLGVAAAVGLGLWWANRGTNTPGEAQQPQPPTAEDPFGTPGI